MSDAVSPTRHSAAFDLLDPRIQQWIWRKRWPALRPAQEAAVRPVLDGTLDVIISAATAAGKTEAAFLPVCTALLRPHATTATGIKVLYVSPLKALINDQWGRLDALCEHLRIPVHRWHGDVAASRKATVLKDPDGILLITPESLEALFVNRGTAVPRLFAGLQYVVIDEMHAFLGTPRGAQLQSLLHRLDLAVRRRTPRIGLSATLGDMTQAQRYLRPHNPDTVLVISEAGDSAELRLQVRGYVEAKELSGGGTTDNARSPAREDDPDDAEAKDDQTVSEISGHLFRVLRGTTNLVFADSRGLVEAYTDRLTRMSHDTRVTNEFVPHHGGLSRELREDVEQRLRDEGRPTTAICTSTLELGIDIGSATSVAQLGAPPSVAALRQRLGRSGRREGDPATLRVYVSEPELTPQLPPVHTLRCQLLQTVAMVDLLLESWFEPLDTADLHLSTLIQQILSMTAQHGGVLPADAYRSLCTHGPFSAVTPAMFVQLLRDMGSAELLTQAGDGLLLPGPTGEQLINHYSFYAAFRSLEEYRLIAEGRTLGTLPIAFPLLPGSMLIFAGRRWKVLAVDDRQKVVELIRSSGGRPYGVVGGGSTVSDEVRARMLTRYQDTDVPAYLDATGQRLLDEGRDYFRRWGLTTRPVICNGSETVLFPWRGDRTLATIAVILARHGLQAHAQSAAVTVSNAGTEHLLDCLDKILDDQPPDPLDLAAAIGNKIEDKYDHYLGDELLNAAYAARSLDVPAALDALRALRSAVAEPADATWEPWTPLDTPPVLGLVTGGPRATLTPSHRRELCAAAPAIDATPISGLIDDTVFAVIDLETTGFSPALGHRVIELAVVRVDSHGHVLDRYCTLVHPDRDPGPQHVQGLAPADLRDAPRFADIADEVAHTLDGTVVVAHNAPFDLSFLTAEFDRLNHTATDIPTLCTLELATTYAPDLPNHRLATCCQAEDIPLVNAHSAAADAEATAALLAAYLQRAKASGATMLIDLGCLTPCGSRRPPGERAAGTAKIRRTCRTSVAAPSMAPATSARAAVPTVAGQLYEAAYRRATADGIITQHERQELNLLADRWHLAPSEVETIEKTVTDQTRT